MTMHPVLDDGQTYPHHNLYFVTSQKWDLRVLGGLLLSRRHGLHRGVLREDAAGAPFGSRRSICGVSACREWATYLSDAAALSLTHSPTVATSMRRPLPPLPLYGLDSLPE